VRTGRCDLQHAGAHAPLEDRIIKCLTAIGLFRSATEQLTQAEGSLSALDYWRSRDGHEIDFVVPNTSADPALATARPS
jgi:hypothetical protein